MAEFTYQYKYSVACSGDCQASNTSNLFCTNLNICFYRGFYSTSSSTSYYTVFSNSSNPDVGTFTNLTQVNNGINIISCSDSNTTTYDNCSYSFTSAGGGGSNGNGGNHNAPTPYNGNIVSSVSGANVILDESAIQSGIGEPMFHRYGQLLNVAITFFPAIFVVSAFWFIYGVIKNIRNKNSLDNKKSLDNR